MRSHRISAFVAIAMFLLLVDLLLGVAMVEGFPKIVYLLVNFPFGAVYLWFESHWVGTRYVISGQTVSETWSFVAFFGSVFAQACLYWVLWVLWDRRYQRRKRRRQGLCLTCAYNLTGNVSGVCPECGTDVGTHPEERA